ncbi:ATP-binding protein [Mycobacteroides sp. PCS013]|uniref:ATP-binding protein n=1 Tax=Mycobacteroides sp. PCS013 TaxID=3074106 RepID=UPI003C2DA666
MISRDLELQELSVFKIGKVVEINGRTVRIRVDKAKNGSHLLYQGKTLRNVSVGGYVKIAKGFYDIIAKVDGEVVTEDSEAGGFYSSKRSHVDRILTVSLLGYFDRAGRFRRGVRELPLTNNDCFLLTRAEFDEIHSFVGPDDVALTIGSLAMEKGQQVKVGVDAVFASHVGIFGNTGSGKSYTLAAIYHQLFEQYKDSETFRGKAKFVLIDFNSEYINNTDVTEDHRSTSVITDANLKCEYILSTRGKGKDRLPISKKTAEDPVFWSVLLDASEKTQAPFIQRTLQTSFWDDKLKDDGALKSEIAYLIHSAIKSGETPQDRGAINHFLKEIALALGKDAPQELTDYADELHANLGYHNKYKTFYFRQSGWTTIWANEPNDDQAFRDLTFGRIETMDLQFNLVKHMNLIRFKLVIQYYSDIFRGFANREHIGPVIKRLETRMPAIKKLLKVSNKGLIRRPLTIISLRDVNLDMKKVIPLLLCRQLYDDKKKSENGEYLNIIIDEAHNILSTSSARENEGWKDYRLETFEEVVKEGRKFGVFLTIASQRPHDISDTIVSQLHNYFLHRLVNNLDIHAIEKAVSYLDKVSFESLPILPTGTCVLSGVSAQVPVIVGVSALAPPYEPNSKTMTLNDKWQPLSGAASVLQ